jgi:cell fate regulator YaaT (PSP1 superfamily)
MQSKTQQNRGDQVIARSNRGFELGEVLCEITDQNQSSTENLPSGSIQRAASPTDLATSAQWKKQAIQEAAESQSIVDSLGLAMQIVEIERIIGGELITVFFTAADRIDFRELVKKLAGKFQARIEMRQIGARDEAKLLGR